MGQGKSWYGSKWQCWWGSCPTNCMGTSTHHYSYLAYNHFIREYLREYFGDERKYWKNKPVYNMTAQSSFNSATFHTDNTADRYSVYTTETHSARWDDTLIWFAFGVVIRQTIFWRGWWCTIWTLTSCSRFLSRSSFYCLEKSSEANHPPLLQTK